ncbi:MAG: S41 family peptidase [Bacteroidota bacterium]
MIKFKFANQFLSILSIGFFLTSCEKAILQNPSTEAKALFDEAWQFADQEYSFFDYKGIDWEDVRQEYAQRISDTTNTVQLFDIIAEMLYELEDGHVNLVSSFDRSRNWRWFLDHPDNFDYDLLERNYFKERERFIGSFTVFDFEDVGYMRYSSFSSAVSSSSMLLILNLFKDHKGIIIDVRENGGGSIGNVYNIAQHFTDTEVVVGRERYRNGFEHDDFSEWEELTIEPYEPEEPQDSVIYTFTKPVVVLTDRSSYSASSFFAQFMKALPNVTTIGDSTGGGGGAPSFTELANGWVIRVSNTQFAAPDGFIIENGVPADIEVDLRESDRSRGVDTILEEALEFLRKQ